MKSKTFISIIAVFSAVILICSVFIGIAYRKIANYELGIKNEYSKNLSELNASVNNITLLLHKARHTSSAVAMSSFAAELYSEAEIAKKALSQLPLSSSPETLNRFLSQVGNYALSVSKNVIKGESLSQSQEENLKVLADTSKTVAEAVAVTDSTYNNSEYWAEEIEERLNSSENSALADSMTELEENMTDFPTLIYDGPYSDHILTKKPVFLENKTQYDSNEALEKAKNAFGFKDADLKFSGEENGRIVCYRYNSGNADVTVTKNGGYPVYYIKNRVVENIKIDYQTAIVKAKEFLESVGYKSMSETYYFTDRGVCVVNFAFLDGQTLCYTDLIKVGVALDNGEIMFLEATGYLFNHTERAFVTPTYTAEQAREKLNANLKVEDTKIALIPTDGGAEKRCFEFLCIGDGNSQMLVYINVNTLEEEQMFVLIKSDGGTLVK